MMMRSIVMMIIIELCVDCMVCLWFDLVEWVCFESVFWVLCVCFLIGFFVVFFLLFWLFNGV